VARIDSKESKKYPSPPFTTSTLQQVANNVLGFSSKRTMALAQVLYQAGHISYMRTDSVNLSQQALDSIRGLISSKYGEKYLPSKPNYYKNKARNAQEAHEAIRPTHFDVSSEQVKSTMGAAEGKLYDLIFKRAVASQMTPRVSQIMNVVFTVKGDNGKDYDFDLKAEKVLFDGFSKIMHLRDVKDEEFAEIEDIKEGQELDNKGMIKEQKFTKPKARFTEATLVKTLEKYGIGRPSTYSTIISTVQDRGYVVKENKYLKPLDVGRVVNTLMKKSFNRLVDYEYTAKVEGGLDDIAEGKVKYLPFMDKEYKQLRTE
jgi:DNA topoisomerase-1